MKHLSTEDGKEDSFKGERVFTNIPLGLISHLWCIIWENTLIFSQTDQHTTPEPNDQKDEMAEGGGETPIYFLEGTRYNISDAVETFAELEAILNEVVLDVGDKQTETQRIIERVKAFMATDLGKIKRESKLREKVKCIRTQLRRRMTEIQLKILTLVELDPRDENAVSTAR